MYRRLFYSILGVTLWAFLLLFGGFSSSCSAQNSDTLATKKGFRLSSNALKEKIRYEAEDSVQIHLKSKKAELYRNTKVDYDDVELTSEQISIDFDSSLVCSRGLPDSNGVITGKPVFKQKESVFYADEIRYQFHTKQGLVYHVITEEGEGLMHGMKIKKINDSVTFVQRGIYTTCNLEHPHYGFAFTKAKVVSGDVIVTRFIRPEIRGIPIPIGLPFSLIPNTQSHRNGILIPSYGESAELGFYLQGLGLYYDFNDCVDLTLTTDIYLRGSFAITAQSNYYKRYKYKGSVQASYSFTRRGEPKTPTYYTGNDFRLNWRHAQDGKAHPTNRFSADVNYQTSSFNKNNITDLNNYVNSNYNSSVSFSTSWGELYSLGIHAGLSQNVSTGVMDLNLPDVNWNISSFYPFRRKEIVGKIRWYENISMAYNAILTNSVQTTDSLFMKAAMFDRMKYGISHSIPISSTIKVFRNIDWNNTLNLNEYWQFKGAFREYLGEDSLHQSLVALDTAYGFYATHQLSYSSALRTTLYGMYLFRTRHLKAIRHELSPSVSFTYTPAINKGMFHSYYDSVKQQEITYTPIDGFLYGTPVGKSSAYVHFSVGNKLEMKTQKKNDTTENALRKHTLLESLNISSSYNVMADSMNWTPLTISGRTTLFKKLYINFNVYLDPYVIDENGKRTNTFEWEANHRLFRMSSTATNLSIGYELSNDLFGKKKVESTFGGWNLSLSYSLNYNLSDNYNYYNLLFLEHNRYNQSLTNTINVRGMIDFTRKWRLEFTSGYDFTNHTVSTSSFNIVRDLHCWEMLFEWRPFGYYRGFEFTIHAKANALQDLKVNIPKDYRSY